MKFSHFFIDRPIFAGVISIIITLIGFLGYNRLAVTQFPDIVPPTIVVTASYPGASPESIAETVATPIEQEINGVENMMYMESSCSADGSLTLTVTFELGTDVNLAQILVQNRVSRANPRLPEEVRNIGVVVNKRSPDFLLMAQIYSSDNSRDKIYLTNYALTRMKDRLARIYGVSDVTLFGSREYSMRIWLDPNKLASLKINAARVAAAIREQSKQVAAGKLNAPPIEAEVAHELMITTKGRLEKPEEFADIIIKASDDGRLTRLKDVARIELGSYTYSDESYLSGKECVTLALFQLPGTNALSTANVVKKELEEMAKSFPTGMDFRIGWDVTAFIKDSVDAVYTTIYEAIALVIIVVMLFLQNWRAAIIPLFAIPVSLIGTFFVMYASGFSLNNLSLFGLVLAIGIVVDDAIVVVENVERNMRDGLPPKEATRKAMTQVQGALIAIALVLSAVFVPTSFIEGISGQFYRQFALTIATSTIISAVVSLTLTPALCALLLKDEHAKKDWFTYIYNLLFGWFFRGFNVVFNCVASFYGKTVAGLTRIAVIVMLIYGGLIFFTGHVFNETPKGFIPKQDAGYYIIAFQLPDGAAFNRTNKVMKGAQAMIDKLDGVSKTIAIVGMNGATQARASNMGAMFVILDDHKSRAARGINLDDLIMKSNGMLYMAFPEAQIFAINPPSVRGIGMGGDFKLQVQDKTGSDLAKLQRYTQTLSMQMNTLPSVASAFSTYRVSAPELYIEIDRDRAQKLNVPISAINETLQLNLSPFYVNDFNVVGRVYRVVLQAESDKRTDISNIYNLKVPSARGGNVPLGSVAEIKRRVGPDRVVRYNLYPSAEITGANKPGFSTGQSIQAVEKLAAEILPEGMGIEWTDLAFQEKRVGNTAMLIFIICVLFVFLLLAALYESWSMPLAVILVVPLVLLFAILGIMGRGMDNNIMTQIGFVVLIGLACKNAILIVEFAKQREDKGEELVSAVSTASKNRLRPILMTSFAFMFGVLPLMYATGAGAELRQALGTSVFYGMLGVTLFGLIFTPVFYFVIRKFVSILSGRKTNNKAD